VCDGGRPGRSSGVTTQTTNGITTYAYAGQTTAPATGLTDSTWSYPNLQGDYTTTLTDTGTPQGTANTTLGAFGTTGQNYDNNSPFNGEGEFSNHFFACLCLTTPLGV
jgi:hypothetical protein